MSSKIEGMIENKDYQKFIDFCILNKWNGVEIVKGLDFEVQKIQTILNQTLSDELITKALLPLIGSDIDYKTMVQLLAQNFSVPSEIIEIRIMQFINLSSLGTSHKMDLIEYSLFNKVLNNDGKKPIDSESFSTLYLFGKRIKYIIESNNSFFKETTSIRS